jgi:hypothetical protein
LGCATERDGNPQAESSQSDTDCDGNTSRVLPTAMRRRRRRAGDNWRRMRMRKTNASRNANLAHTPRTGAGSSYPSAMREVHRSQTERVIQGSSDVRERSGAPEVSLRLIAMLSILGVLIYLFANGGGY